MSDDDKRAYLSRAHENDHLFYEVEWNPTTNYPANVEALDAATEAVEKMKALAERVIGGDWGEMRDDPGDYPSNAGGSAMPSRFCASSDPHDLAAAVLDYLDAREER